MRFQNATSYRSALENERDMACVKRCRRLATPQFLNGQPLVPSSVR